MKRALLSVSDKSGLIEFARALHDEFGFDLLSTGGTAKYLRDAGLPVTDVADVTGFPEMMGGRVKTLHPKIHGGLLARRDDPSHVAAMSEHGIEPIDLVCVNLYPFAVTVAKKDVTFDEAIENIDIGGPSMIRSAAKNHEAVSVVTSPEQYGKVIDELREQKGNTSATLRQELALAAFHHTAQYDATIADYLARSPSVHAMRSGPLSFVHGREGHGEGADALSDTSAAVPRRPSPPPSPRVQGEGGSNLPPDMGLGLKRAAVLRYGENPHQAAALYVDSSREPGGLAAAKQLHGKELSYINLLDADAALACVAEFDRPAACIVKHATPCGVAVDETAAAAFVAAYDSDPLAAFGGIVAINRPIDLAAANAIVTGQKFLEVILAPGFADDAAKLIGERWKNVRLLSVDEPLSSSDPIVIRSINGGYLVQERDITAGEDSSWRVVSKALPTASQRDDLYFAWLTCKHVKSNAIVLANHGATVGIGGGQVDRVGAAKIALDKAGERARGSVAASDAFFPFADGPKSLLAAGVTAIIQPGGSVRDAESIAAVDEAGAVMIFTGERHFRH